MPARKYLKERTNSFLYSTWHGMLQRCYDRNSSNYDNYGGRGINICEEWKNSYDSFFEWAVAHGASKELSIDRINNDKGYSPDNCRWVGLKTQARNKRTTRLIYYRGASKPLCEWAEITGISADVIRTRLDRYGYTIEEALGFKEHETVMPKRPNCRKRVIQQTMDGKFIKEWKDVNEIEAELHIPVHAVRFCCGERKSSYGFIWKYK